MAAEVDQAETLKVNRYLQFNYMSLGKPIEIIFKTGKLADGIFAGINLKVRSLIVRRFCFRDEEFFTEIQEVKIRDISSF